MSGKKISTKILIVSSLIFIFFFAGCGKGDSSKKDDDEVRTKKEERAVKKVQNFSMELESKEKTKAGSSTEMTLKVKNDGSKSKKVSYGSPRRHDFEIFDSEGNMIWCQTCKDFFIQVVEEDTLDVDEEITFSASWDQVDNEGKVVKAGVYTLKASWFALESGGSVKKKIEIVD